MMSTPTPSYLQHKLTTFTLVIGAILFSFTLEKQANSAEPKRTPNIVFFLVDDLGWKDIGVYGSSFYHTPNVDGLAASGMRFTNAYAACQVCSPTRASIMTGKYPQRVGITDYIGAAQPDKWKRNTPLLPAPYQTRLALEETTLAEALKQRGYATFFAGKWHLGPEGNWPEDQGFDVNIGGIDRGGPYGGKKYFSPYGNPRLTDGPDGEHLPDRLASETVKFIEQHQDQPFLAYLSFYSVHTPLMAREDLKQKYDEIKQRIRFAGPIWGEEGKSKLRLVQEHSVYAGMVEAMDAAVGKVLDALDRLKLTDNTLVIFTSDNGGLSTSEGHPTSNLPLRGGKGWMYEGGIREPLVVRYPGVTSPGSESDALVTSPDFLPTILAVVDKPGDKIDTDGVSIISALEGKPLDRGPIFWHYPHYGNQGGSPTAAVREGDWKLIEWYEDGKVELFNLADDIGEKQNLADQQPEKRKELHQKLRQWRKAVGAILPTANPNYKATK
ncbi:sulfatase [Blastopirellula marina]|uniref:N-acetylgalactosamine 6-sulfate sulfatase (GALNS) n=1 Tax=Blastopirellula marina DSM 3645 TaxID=314230 RepID=A3ZVD1_9BACT|nr:N-acetylgalactosamine 6-sulfate sulfatase (GALNS) [Blastopirellula marina DSM 3645]